MIPIDRRTFLKTTGAAIAATSFSAHRAAAATPPWRKAFMLGTTKGPILPDFELLKDAGFEGVEMISPNQLNREEVLAAKAKTGLVIHGVSGSVHWQKTLSDPDPQTVEQGMAAIIKELEDCQAYGGTTVLVVPAVVNKQVSYRDAYKRSQENIRKLLPHAERFKIKIAVEEVWNKFLLSPVEFGRYIDEFESPWIGAYFDVGNVVEYGYPQEWIRELGKRILKIHIKEYAKPNRFSYLLGEGKEIDWADVRKALLDVGYEGWISAEVPKGNLAQMRDVVARMDKLLTY